MLDKKSEENLQNVQGKAEGSRSESYANFMQSTSGIKFIRRHELILTVSSESRARSSADLYSSLMGSTCGSLTWKNLVETEKLKENFLIDFHQHTLRLWCDIGIPFVTWVLCVWESLQSWRVQQVDWWLMRGCDGNEWKIIFPYFDQNFPFPDFHKFSYLTSLTDFPHRNFTRSFYCRRSNLYCYSYFAAFKNSIAKHSIRAFRPFPSRILGQEENCDVSFRCRAYLNTWRDRDSLNQHAHISNNATINYDIGEVKFSCLSWVMTHFNGIALQCY